MAAWIAFVAPVAALTLKLLEIFFPDADETEKRMKRKREKARIKAEKRADGYIEEVKKFLREQLIKHTSP